LSLKLLWALPLAFGVAYISTPWVRRLAVKVGATDTPNERKVHHGIMPRMGGLAIYLGFVVAVLLTQSLSRPLTGLLLGGTLIVLMGMVDDIRGVSPKMKLLGQIAAAFIVVGYGVKVQYITNPFSGLIILGKWGIPVTVFWIIGVTNALNLIDGLDGLAAGTSAIAAVTMAVVAWTQGQMAVAGIAFILAAAALGFLRYNYHPAQLFMGDSGSMFLGFALATLAVMGLTKGATIISLFVPVVILGIPILDTMLAIVRRYLNNQPIFQADKAHLHHRLLDLGLSHPQTVLVIYGVNLVLGVSAVLLTVLTTDQAVVILIGLASVTLWAANRLGVLARMARMQPQKVQVEEQKNYYQA